MHKIMLGKLLVSLGVVSILATNFVIDSSKFSFNANNKSEAIEKKVNKDYILSESIESKDEKLKNEIEQLSKKTTYLLLGEANTTNESSEEYYRRRKDYLELRYDPEVPKSDSYDSGYDESSKEYKEGAYSGYIVPGIFLKVKELGIVYSSIDNISVSDTGDMVMSVVNLSNITIKEQSKEDPMKYERVKTNLVFYYFFKEYKGEYKLYSLLGETTDELETYTSQIEESESKSMMQMAQGQDTQLQELYNHTKLDMVTDIQIEKIKNDNASNLVIFNSYYNNYVVASANGFFINEGIVVTTWNFMKKCLSEAQYIVAKDINGNVFEIDGIVTFNEMTDVVVIKLKDKVNKKSALGEFEELKSLDPVFTISSKTGVGACVQGGVVISTDGYIESDIPLITKDEGSPLINSSGQVVGMNTAKQVNSNISKALNSDILKEVQEKFTKIKFEEIETITFDKLKEEFYYVEYNDEIVKNSIPKDTWKVTKKIGNIDKNITAKLVKASCDEGVVSLRYHNTVAEYIDNMQLVYSFREQLKKDGFEENVTSSKKCIYVNKEYRVIIMSEFDYIIVVMETL